jgi:two-component system sensor histidine kinase/response regulator
MVKINTPGPIILLVDDNHQNLQVLGKLLQEEKYKIEFALNGESALDWLNNKQFDLILLDLHMPGMNGFEVCKRIRSDKTVKEIPIIFLSAESERESILKGFEVGAQDYVTKPFDSRELLARVKTQLDLKSKTENLRKVNEWLARRLITGLKRALACQRLGRYTI